MDAIYNGFKKVANAVSKALYFVACVMIVLLVLFTAYEVIRRYVFNNPTIWTYDVDCYLYIAITLLSLGVVEMDNRHMSMDFLPGSLKGKALQVDKLVIALFSLAFGVFMVIFGWQYAWAAFVKGSRASSLFGAPLWPSMMAVPIGFFGMCLQNIVQIMDCIRAIAAKEPQA